MNIKDILFTFLLVFTAWWTLQFFFPTYQPSAESGQRVTVAQEPVEIKPLNTEVTIADRLDSISEKTTEVVTKHGRLLFSTVGASLQGLEFKRKVDGRLIMLTTLTPTTDVEQQPSFFLVALNEKTPYSYTLENHSEDDRIAKLTYRASTSVATIEKTYVVYKDLYKIDVDLTIKPRTTVQPRIFFAAPSLVGLEKTEQLAGIVEENKSLVKYQQSRYVRELTDNFWKQPTLFGAEDRYFVNAMVADPNHFAQRGYYKVETNHLYSILEGPTITQETSWKISFYVGPKEQAAMAVVDQRLEGVLDFGWLAPISKLMLWILLWLNNLVHNFGLAIIILTLFLRLLLVPFSLRGARQQEKWREMNKKLQYLRQKYKDNPEELQREQNELYKKHGFGMGGCLPMLLQFPIIIAMNRVLSSSIELYQAPFLWIPDLSASDPFYILPFLVAGSLFLTMQAQASGDVQQKISGTVAAILIGTFSIGFPSGLALFIAVSSFAGVAQTFIQNKLKL